MRYPIVLAMSLMVSTAPASHALAPAHSDTVRISFNRDGRFAPGDDAEIDVRSRVDGFLLVMKSDPSGVVRVLYPHRPDDQRTVRADRRYEVWDRTGREELFRANARGAGRVVAMVSSEPWQLEMLSTDGRFDRRRITEVFAGRELEDRLLELAPAWTTGAVQWASRDYVVDDQFRPPTRVVHDVPGSGFGWGRGWASWGLGGWGPGFWW